jgi:hypothetical protein
MAKLILRRLHQLPDIRQSYEIHLDGTPWESTMARLGPEFLRLVESHPDGCGKSLCLGGHPQPEHFDALVRLAGATQRAGDAPGGVLGVPSLEPWADALFQFGNDGVGVFRHVAASIHLVLITRSYRNRC